MKLKPIQLFLMSIALTLTGCIHFYQLSKGPIDRSDLPIHVKHIKGNVYLVEDYNYWKTNSLIYMDSKKIFFIDSTWTPKGAMQLLRDASLNFTAEFDSLIVTSHALHRSGGSSMFEEKRVPVIYHKLTPELHRTLWSTLQQNMMRSFGSWKYAPVAEGDRLFDKELKFNDGKIIVRYLGAGITPDNCVVLFPKEKILYAGSLLSNPLLFTEELNPDGAIAMIKEIRKWRFDTIVAGHGKAIHNRTLLDQVEHELNKIKSEQREP